VALGDDDDDSAASALLVVSDVVVNQHVAETFHSSLLHRIGFFIFISIVKIYVLAIVPNPPTVPSTTSPRRPLMGNSKEYPITTSWRRHYQFDGNEFFVVVVVIIIYCLIHDRQITERC
jgi:hypothetical protein